MSEEAVHKLAEAATSRADVHDERLRVAEDRIRALELSDARRDGAAGGMARVVPWLALVVAVAGVVANIWSKL